jgi:ABC-type uncharacterized transport system permease subunit
MAPKWREHLGAVLRPLFAAAVGLAFGVGATYFAGENPWNVFSLLVGGAFGSTYDVGMTIFYMTPLILTGLAVAIPFKAGLFNIGAEGQLTIGALSATLVGLVFPGLPPFVAIPAAACAAFAGGATWAIVPAWLKVRRGSHEVITTIMMNFIAAGLASWVVLDFIATTESQSPESRALSPAYLLSPFKIFDGAPAGPGLLLALFCALLLYGVLRKTSFGFEIKTVGANPEASSMAGIRVARTQCAALLIGGGLAGLVGVAEVLGHAGRYRIGFSADYGFIGIPVALLARCHPIGLIFSALLFGGLQKGTGELDLETEHVTRELAQLIQAFVVLAVASEGAFSFWRRSKTISPEQTTQKEHL